MSIYLDEKNPGKHKPFEDASPDIVEYVRYLEVIAGKSANTAFSYFCDLRGFSRFMKRRRGLVPADSEMQDIDPKGLDTAFWASVTKEDIYEYLYFLNRECGNKKSSTARRLASLHGFYDYLVNQVNRLDSDPTAAIKPDCRTVYGSARKHPDPERFPGAGLLHGGPVPELRHASVGTCGYGLG